MMQDMKLELDRPDNTADAVSQKEAVLEQLLEVVENIDYARGRLEAIRVDHGPGSLQCQPPMVTWQRVQASLLEPESLPPTCVEQFVTH